WLAAARKLAADEDAAEAGRTAAVHLLARKGDVGRTAVPVFAELLTPRNPPGLQEAAVAALARVGTADAADRLLAAWKGMTPRVRGRAVDALVSRDAWTDRL